VEFDIASDEQPEKTAAEATVVGVQYHEDANGGRPILAWPATGGDEP